MRKLYLLLFFTLILMAWGCKDKLTCPAYQSTFILKNEERKRFFSHFDDKDVPKPAIFVEKDKRGLVSRRRKEYKIAKLKTVRMEGPQEKVEVVDSMEFAEREITDSASLLSKLVEKKIGYNVDQNFYLAFMSTQTAITGDPFNYEHKNELSSQHSSSGGDVETYNEKDEFIEAEPSDPLIEGPSIEETIQPEEESENEESSYTEPEKVRNRQRSAKKQKGPAKTEVKTEEVDEDNDIIDDSAIDEVPESDNPE